MVGIKKDGYNRSRTCVSRVKSLVHSRFATYPDISYRAHDVRVDVGSAPTGVERRPFVKRRPEWNGDIEPAAFRLTAGRSAS